jgi:alpha-1,6-mannosyltransferase
MLTRLRSRVARQTIIAVCGAVVLALLFVTLLRLRDLKTYVVEAIAIGLAAGLVYFILLYLLERAPEHPGTLGWILFGAVGFRLLLLPLPPSLSDDLHRYRWEGHIQQLGANPYLTRPADPAFAQLAEEFRSRRENIPGADIPAIYPPLAELIFRLAGEAARAAPRAALLLFKLPAFLGDLVLLTLLAWWIRSTGGRSVQLAIYAWNPLVLVEFAASGHFDALAIAVVLAARFVLTRGRQTVSTVLLAAGVLLKWFPVMLLPLWLRRIGGPRTQAWPAVTAAALLTALCAWPYRAAWPEVLDVLTYFESRWHHNNASLYALLTWLADPAAPQDPQVAIPPGTASHEFAAGLGFGIVAGLALWVAVRKLDVLRAAYLLFGAALLLAPNAFPWYFTWMVPLLVFFPNPAWLLLTVLQFLSYHVLIPYQAFGVWRFQPQMLWLVYGPFYAWLAATQLRLNRNQHPTPPEG